MPSLWSLSLLSFCSLVSFDCESPWLSWRAPWNAVALLSFYSEGTVGRFLKPLVTRGAGVRTRVLVFPGAGLSRAASHSDAQVPANLPHALGAPMNFHPYYLVSSSQLGAPSLDSTQKAVCCSGCPGCQGLSHTWRRMLFFVPIVCFYLNAFDIVCSAPLCDFWNHQWVLSDLASFQKVPQSWSRWEAGS